MSSALPIQVTGLWLGHRTAHNGDMVASMRWALALTTRPNAPSAFGAWQDDVGGDGGDAGETTAMLHGTWSTSTQRVTLRSCHSDANAGSWHTYVGGLSRASDDSLLLHGSWQEMRPCADGGDDNDLVLDSGTFVVRLEPDNGHQSHCCAIFVGEAAPHTDLAPFAIPVNPIQWCVAFVDHAAHGSGDRATANEGTGDGGDRCGEADAIEGLDCGSEGHPSGWQRVGSHIFGCGFWDDAADVPGRPLLLYGVSGRVTGAPSAAADTDVNVETVDGDDADADDVVDGAATLCHFRVVKRYEHGPETADYAVRYTGCLRTGPRNRLCMSGSWNNDHAGSYGTFVASSHGAGASADYAANISLCAHCTGTIVPGERRWSCTTCRLPHEYILCDGCHSSSDTPMHEHEPLEASVSYPLAAAQGSCCAEVIASALRSFHDRPFFAWRPHAAPTLRWLTYADVGAVSHRLARYLSARAAQQGEQACISMGALTVGPRVVVIGTADAFYASVILATLLAGLTVVPVQPGLGVQALVQVLKRIAPVVVVCTPEHESSVTQAIPQLGAATPHTFVTYSDPWERTQCVPGTPNDLWQLCAQATPDQGDALASPEHPLQHVSAILFTSGSTGSIPKGVMFTEELMLPSEGLAVVQPFVRLDWQPFDPSFVLSLHSTLHSGGSRIFSTLESMNLDMREGRPTHLGASPIFWTHLRSEWMSLVTRLQQASSLDDVLLPEDAACVPRMADAKDAEAVADAVLQARLGNRLRVGTSGGAKLSPAVAAWIRDRLKVDLVELYGSRETGGIARDTRVYPGLRLLIVEPRDVHEPCAETKSLDRVCGELCISSPRAVPGYWQGGEGDAAPKSPFVRLATHAASTLERPFVRTGDVVEVWNKRGPVCGRFVVMETGERAFLVDVSSTLCVRVMDRLGALVKLSQGEWIAPAEIETMMEACPYVHQALVMAKPQHSFCVAVVVPSPLLNRVGSGDDADAAQERMQALRRQVRLHARQCHFKAFEVPQAFHFECAPWSWESGDLTATSKKRRTHLLQRYAEVCSHLYAAAHSRGSDGGGDADALVLDASPEARAFTDAIASVLPSHVAVASLDADATLSQQGVDSLSLARLSQTLSVSYPSAGITLGTLLHHTLAHVWDLVCEARTSGLPAHVCLPSDTQAHRDSVQWHLEARLPPNFATPLFPSTPARVAVASPAEPPVIVCTGSTGFLGPFLVHHLLQCFPQHCIHCVVRASDDAHATERMCRALAAASLPSPPKNRLVVHAGRVDDPDLGLRQEVYVELAQRVTHVLHNAARVNMRLPYEALRGPNVMGTLHMLRFAHAGEASFHHVSSVGALGASAVAARETWCALGPSELRAKDGYGQSKAMAERLVAHASQEHSMRVQVYRPGTICGDQVHGSGNRNDFVNLMLSLCVEMGCYPDGASTSLNMIPVDFVASFIVQGMLMMTNPPVASSHFHLTGDGPTMGRMFAGLVRMGYDLEAVAANEWKARLERHLRDPEHPAFGVRELLLGVGFGCGAPVNETSSVDRSQARVWAQAAGLAWPRVTDEHIDVMLQWLRANGAFQ